MKMRTVRHFGIDLPIDVDAMSPNVLKAIKQGRYEAMEARQVQQIVQYRERILEVGGGIGFVSALAGVNAQTEALRVYEANPDLCGIIEDVHARNGVTNAQVVHGVLSNGPQLGDVDFYRRNDFWASSLSPQPWGYKDVVQVPQFGFAQVVEAFRPTIVIADIEGGELDLFLNANLTGVEKVLVEVHQRVLGRPGVKKLFDAFSARDFHYDLFHSSGSVVLFSHVNRDGMRKARQRADQAD